jgi:hypothetical protein
MGIQLDKDEEQDSERPQRRASITKERQWYPYHGKQPNCHGNIDKEVEKYQGDHTIAIDSGKPVFLPFSQHD